MVITIYFGAVESSRYENGLNLEFSFCPGDEHANVEIQDDSGKHLLRPFEIEIADFKRVLLLLELSEEKVMMKKDSH